jgi:hypothetical protein
MHRPTRLCLALATTFGLGLGACDAMTDDSYRGELLFSLEGTIATALPSDPRLYLVWDWADGIPNVAEQLDIEPTFPATFELNVFTTPRVLSPELAQYILEPGESRFTWGYVYAAARDATFASPIAYPWMTRDPAVFGTDPRHMIAYMPDPVPEGSITANFLHGGVDAGFHIYELKCIGPAKRAEIEACLARFHFPATVPELSRIAAECGSLTTDFMLRPAPDGLDTELTVEVMDDLQSWQPDPSECL